MAQLKRYNGSSWEYVGGNIAPKTSKTTSDTDVYSCNYINNIVGKTNTLWSGTSASVGEKALSDSIENYDFILIGIQAGSWSKKSELIPVSDIVYHTTAGQSNDTYDITAFQSTSVYADLQVYFKDATTLYVRSESHAGWGAPDLKYVIGIKL